MYYPTLFACVEQTVDKQNLKIAPFWWKLFRVNGLLLLFGWKGNLQEFLLQLPTEFLSPSLRLAFWDLICSKLRAADKFSQILWHFQTNPFHCWENPDEIIWKAFLIGCWDWENKGKRNFTEHTQYYNIEEENQEQVCNDLYLKEKWTSSILKVSRILQLLCTPWHLVKYGQTICSMIEKSKLNVNVRGLIWGWVRFRFCVQFARHGSTSENKWLERFFGVVVSQI